MVCSHLEGHGGHQVVELSRPWSAMGSAHPRVQYTLCLTLVKTCHTTCFCHRCFHLPLPFVLLGRTEKEGEPHLISLFSVNIPTNRVRFFLAGLFSGCHNSRAIRGPCCAPLSILIPYFGKKDSPLEMSDIGYSALWLAGCSAGGGAEHSPGHEASRN